MCLSPTPCGDATRGDILFPRKENIPPYTPQEKGTRGLPPSTPPIASEQLEELQCLPIALPTRGKAAFDTAIRFDLLLSSAAALPISWQCSLISVYRGTTQCGERSNAAFGRQSAAVLTSLAPHGSKARLRVVTTRRRFMAKPCTPHLIAQRVQLFKLFACNGKSFSWGSKGAILFCEREWPL